MRFAYYDRLSAARQRVYRQSDAIESLGLPRGLELGAHVAAIREALVLDRRTDVQAACQSLIDALTGGYHVPKVRIRVLATRPADADGELHGLYEPVEDGSPPRISVWMRTAQKRKVVAFKTFLRTLIHELCHHLDYELFALAETFHTEGFYKRESSVVTALLAQAAP
jgi:DNA-binding transcriptional MerR regulator